MFDCFFFQAEDGIRDLVRSRGLGDVYKRQTQPLWVLQRYSAWKTRDLAMNLFISFQDSHCMFPVSYTHLTLPTSDLV